MLVKGPWMLCISREGKSTNRNPRDRYRGNYWTNQKNSDRAKCNTKAWPNCGKSPFQPLLQWPTREQNDTTVEKEDIIGNSAGQTARKIRFLRTWMDCFLGRWLLVKNHGWLTST